MAEKRVVRKRAGQGSDIDALLRRALALARNLWWTWNGEAQQFFASLDAALWEATNHNPIQTIRRLSAERRAALTIDKTLDQRLAACERALRAYLRARPWFARTARGAQRQLRVAYFCAEYGLHECLPLYSGGLGILAGDHLKSASDLGVPLVGVGLMYRSGYYHQVIAPDGGTRVACADYDYADWPVTDTGKIIAIPFGRRTVKARVWRAEVGRVPLLLLDSDVAGNRPDDRHVTRHLYGGDREYRLRQELLLGVGGVLALKALRIRPTVYHLNEGHAAFCTVQRLLQLRGRRMTLAAATEAIRRSTVFTTHTPVPAGHERFDPALVTRYFGAAAAKIGLKPSEFLGLGRTDPTDGASSEPFCMTTLALRHSNHCNGVAELHGATSRRMWTAVYGVADPDEVPIGHVTNGIHSESWLADEARPFYAIHLKPRWAGADPGADFWTHVDAVPDEALWTLRNVLRRRLVAFVRERLIRNALEAAAAVGTGKSARARAHGTQDMDALRRALCEDTLTIGFARRFAAYKRAPLLFSQPDRLAAMVRHLEHPVQFVFAGKAHPADVAGQKFLQAVHRFAHDPRFAGRIVLLPAYDYHVARVLVSGCDVWLNTPRRPMEASGTSGMKGPLHGGLNLSILDGWWPEAFNGRNGWAIGDATELPDASAQDRKDAESLYDVLEQEVIPTFYDRDAGGIPFGWTRMMREAMRTVCARFSAGRMVGDYIRRYYMPAHGGRDAG
ncbi:MAG: alpha-glucan family phosphorylase [Phycisphaerales bacterium]|nr:MAG: alpha-glucan family phosphorylase [Phycisphaerales bacterium]